MISNLIAHILDIKLNKLANRLRCTYTRYADDITFSTNEKEFPQEIARLVRGSHDKWVAGDKVLREVYRAGFKVNHDKSRMQRRDSRQDTTGLIVNQKLNVRHEYYKQARAMCHNLFVHGYAHSGTDRGRVPIKNEMIEGMLGFIHQVRSLKNAEFFKADQPGFSSLYGKFLDYQSFYGILRPRIIGEGKTDNIYIKSAIKSLAAKFPELVDPTTPITTAVDFFRYNKRSSTFQDLSGGTGEMRKLLASYRHRMASFKHVARHPVIMVVDNDAASTSLFKYVSEVLGTPIGGMDPYYHVFENLYLAPIPKTSGHVAIEDLFDPTLLAETIDGRTFDRSNKKFDATKFYGKNEFATKIIAPKRATIDFSKFEPLLQAFVDIMADYEIRYAAAIVAAKARAAAA